MHIAFGHSSKKAHPRYVRIRCPACQNADAEGLAQDVDEELTFFHLIPVYKSHSTFVTCFCGATLLSSRSANELADSDANQTARYLRVRISPIVRALVFGGIVAWLLPVAGLIWNTCAFVGARRHQTWMRRMSLVLLILSAVTSSFLLIPFFLPNDPTKKISPSKAAEPTRTAVSPPAGAGDRASGARGSDKEMKRANQSLLLMPDSVTPAAREPVARSAGPADV